MSRASGPCVQGIRNTDGADTLPDTSNLTVDPGSAGQQAHVQQAALVLGTLAELYPGVKITGTFQRSYDFPEAIEEEQLYSFTETGEKVPWTANRVANPPQYILTLLH